SCIFWTRKMYKDVRIIARSASNCEKFSGSFWRWGFFTASRLHRYYEPLRHPIRPGLSLTSCQLIHTAITAGTSRVAYGPFCLHAVANTPAGRMETCPLVRFHPLRPSHETGAG